MVVKDGLVVTIELQTNATGFVQLVRVVLELMGRVCEL